MDPTASAEREMRRLIDDVLATGRDCAEHAASVPPALSLMSSPAWRALSQRWVDARERLDDERRDIERRLAAGDVAAVGPALAFLEADPYYFRSGYARCRLAGRVSLVPLSGPLRARACRIVLGSVDGEYHCPQPGIGRLAGSVADNGLRRSLRDRLGATDAAVARRALRVIVRIPHPGLRADDLKTARALVLRDAGEGPFLTPSVERLALWLGDPEWEAELREIGSHHGPQRAGAKRLVESADRRTERKRQRNEKRPGP